VCNQNLTLRQTIKILNDEEKFKIISKTKTIQFYDKLVQENRSKYADLRRALMLSKLYKNGVNEENKDILREAFYEEHESLKKQYFFAKAIAIKLSKSQQGKYINIDIQNLYERAKDIHHNEYDAWIEKEIDKEETKE